MKKVLYIFFAGVLLFLICAVVLYAASAVELGPSSIRVNEKSATLSSPYSSVKILQLTDIQLTTVSDADRAFPIVETVEAHSEYEKTPAIGSGVKREEVCEQDGNSGFFNAAKSLGSTDAIFYGHDHVNNTIIEYDGIAFCYGLKTGKNSYYDDDLQGANLITVTKNGYTVDRIYAESAKNAQNAN